MIASRNISVDLLKAIGIISIIIGHYGFLRGVVYSFHVPLFFIVGGFVYRQRSFKEELKIDSKRLLIPYALTAFAIAAWKSIMDWRCGNISTISDEWIAALFGCGLPQNMLLFGKCNQIGAIWFLLALFVCRTVYNLLSFIEKQLYITILCFLISISSILFYNHHTPLPFDILQGLSALVFYDFGHNLHNIKILKNKPIVSWLACGIVWLCTLLFSSMNMVICYYKIFPLDIAGAICATLFLWGICQRIKMLPSKWMINWVIWIGQNSLGLLCLHLLDLEINLLHKIQHFIFGTYYHNSIIHCALVIIISCAVIYVYNLMVANFDKLRICKNS